MWFNSMQREKPYQGLKKGTLFEKKDINPFLQVVHGCRQLVS